MVTINKGVVDDFVKDPFFSSVIARSGYKSVGIKVVEDGNVIHELTSSYDKKKINLKKGIRNPDFIVGIDHKFLKSLNKKKLDWIRNNPIKAYLKYHDRVDLPFFVKLSILGMLKNEA